MSIRTGSFTSASDVIASLSQLGLAVGDTVVEANAITGGQGTVVSLGASSVRLDVPAVSTGSVSFATTFNAGGISNITVSASQAILSGLTNVTSQSSIRVFGLSALTNIYLLRAESTIEFSGSDSFANIKISVSSEGDIIVSGGDAITIQLSVDSLTVQQVIKEILTMFGWVCGQPIEQCLLDKAIIYLNQAMQLIWSQAVNDKDYFSKQRITVTLVGGESSIELPDDVQHVIGGVYIKNSLTMLQQARHRGEILNMAGYLGVDTPVDPFAVYIDAKENSKADIKGITLQVFPTPISDTDLEVETAVQCPRYDQYSYNRNDRIRIQDGYIESILLPIARHSATSSVYYQEDNRLPAIQEDYQRALAMIGLNDPVQKDKKVHEKAV